MKKLIDNMSNDNKNRLAWSVCMVFSLVVGAISSSVVIFTCRFVVGLYE